MYYGRTLSGVEEAYVNKAQQRIAQLGSSISDEISVNDVTYEDSQISVELQYSIEVLKYSALDWTQLEIDTMMDYYTLRANLMEFAVCSITHQAIYILAGAGCATIEMLAALKDEILLVVKAWDDDLWDALNQEIQDREDGDQAIWDYLAGIGGGGGSLENDLTSEQKLGGIRIGDDWVSGTKLEELWKDLLKINTVLSNLQIVGYSEVVEVGSFNIAGVTWDVDQGTPGLMTLNDNQGIINGVSVLGSSYLPTGGIDYTLALGNPLIIGLSIENADGLNVELTPQYFSYAGVNQASNDTPIVITSAMLQVAHDTGVYRALTKTGEEISFNVNSLNDYQGWIAVEQVQTGQDYTKWFVEEINKGDVAVGDFIIPAMSLTFDGRTYKVYRWGYRSPLNKQLKLHR